MITIYGKSACPFCTKAKVFCEMNGIAYDYHSIDDNPALRDMIIAHGMTSVPCVFDGAELIGGYQHLVDYFEIWDDALT